MTLWLLDTNVFRALGPNGHRNVQRWLGTTDDAALRVSVMTLLEMRHDWEAKRKQDPVRAAESLARLVAVEATFKDRIIAIDAPIVAEWARLVGEKDKHRDDRTLAATARVRVWCWRPAMLPTSVARMSVSLIRSRPDRRL